MSEEILLNIMFTGSYLEDTNIGHEIINLFKSDNGSNYIYVLPYGTMHNTHNNKIKTILLVKRHSSKILEIIAKATDLEQIIYINKTLTQEQEAKHAEQINYIDNNNITYGDLKPYKIFKENAGNEKAMYITFKAGSVLKATQPIYISTDKANENCYYMEDIIKFPSQSPKMYISSNTKGFEVLQKIIKNKENWERVNSTQSVSNTDHNYNKTHYDFIDIIKKGYDELVFSNLFKYIFDSNQKGCFKFIHDVLKIENVDTDNVFTTQREWNNIDLFLTNNEHAIVIENKIKSDINGRHDIGGEIVQTQLDKYRKIVGQEYKKYRRHFFVFAPDYNHINMEKYDKNRTEKYILIKYSQIAKFFETNKDIYKDTPYFNEFLYALSKHAKSINNFHEEIMYKRFTDAINNIRKINP